MTRWKHLGSLRSNAWRRPSMIFTTNKNFQVKYYFIQKYSNEDYADSANSSCDSEYTFFFEMTK